MKLTINGEESDLDVQTLGDVLQHFQLDRAKVAVELNKQIQKEMSAALHENDTIEIVSVVGGG